MQFTEDIRYSLRQFAHAPGFTATAVLTLALGIGATTAIFTLIHVVLLKSLPVAKPSELYRVGDNENCCVNGGLQDNWSLFSYDKYKTFRDNTTGFTELAAFQAGRGLKGIRRAGSNQPAESQRTQYVSGNYFSMLGIGELFGVATKVWPRSIGDRSRFHVQWSARNRGGNHAAWIQRRPDRERACLLDSA